MINKIIVALYHESKSEKKPLSSVLFRMLQKLVLLLSFDLLQFCLLFFVPGPQKQFPVYKKISQIIILHVTINY